MRNSLPSSPSASSDDLSYCNTWHLLPSMRHISAPKQEFQGKVGERAHNAKPQKYCRLTERYLFHKSHSVHLNLLVIAVSGAIPDFWVFGTGIYQYSLTKACYWKYIKLTNIFSRCSISFTPEASQKFVSQDTQSTRLFIYFFLEQIGGALDCRRTRNTWTRIWTLRWSAIKTYGKPSTSHLNQFGPAWKPSST